MTKSHQRLRRTSNKRCSKHERLLNIFRHSLRTDDVRAPVYTRRVTYLLHYLQQRAASVHKRRLVCTGRNRVVSGLKTSFAARSLRVSCNAVCHRWWECYRTEPPGETWLSDAGLSLLRATLHVYCDLMALTVGRCIALPYLSHTKSIASHKSLSAVESTLYAINAERLGRNCGQVM